MPDNIVQLLLLDVGPQASVFFALLWVIVQQQKMIAKCDHWRNGHTDNHAKDDTLD